MEAEAHTRSERLGCSRCGQVRLTTIEQKRSFDVGLETPLVIQVESMGCERCGRLVKPAAVARVVALTALRQVAISGLSLIHISEPTRPY